MFVKCMENGRRCCLLTVLRTTVTSEPPCWCLPCRESARIEPYAPIGPRYGDKKEYYVLIRAQKAAKDENPSERFRQQIVSDLLMNNPNIKEISEVDSKPQKFHYAIQVEASSYDVDDIIFRMDSWAHHNGVPFGTRT